MRVLIIPSWYPHPAMPHAGRFIVEQATYLAKADSLEVNILNWGQNALQLRIRKPVESLSAVMHYFFSRLSGSDLPKDVKELIIPHLTWTSYINKGNISSLANKIILPSPPDIIHAHVSFPAGYLALLLSRKYHIPYLITEHSGPFPLPEHERAGKVSPLVSEPLRNAAEVIAVSSYQAAEIEDKTGVKPIIIPNMVDTDYYCPEGSNSHDTRPFTFFALSSLTEAKGALDLLEAATLLKQSGLNFQLRWGGSGYLTSRIRSHIHKNNLQKEIVLLGSINRDSALNEYRNCDCFIMPSRLESFSMVLIEAMACGCPLIATACGGPQDIVDCNTGVLTPPSSPIQLFRSMQYMRENIPSFNRDTIRNICIKRYDRGQLSKQILNLYKDVLNKS